MSEFESPDFRKLGDEYADAILGSENPERAALRELREALRELVERGMQFINSLKEDNPTVSIATAAMMSSYRDALTRALLAALDAEEGGKDA